MHAHIYIAHTCTQMQTRGHLHELALTLAGCWVSGFLCGWPLTWFRATRVESWRVTGPASLSEGLGAPAHFHSAVIWSGTMQSS